MKTQLDDAGRIELPALVRAQLGVKPGDEIVLENAGGQWLIRSAPVRSGLLWKGNVLVHEGLCTQPVEQVQNELRDERLRELSEGLAP